MGEDQPDGSFWRVGIEQPSPGPSILRQVLNLSDRAVATSGNYRQFFEQDGRSYSHVLDPRTGAPVEHSLASVTVLSDDVMTADAVSTALMVMGPNEGVEFAQRNSMSACFTTRTSGGFADTFTGDFRKWVNT